LSFVAMVTIVAVVNNTWIAVWWAAIVFDMFCCSALHLWWRPFDSLEHLSICHTVTLLETSSVQSTNTCSFIIWTQQDKDLPTWLVESQIFAGCHRYLSFGIYSYFFLGTWNITSQITYY